MDFAAALIFAGIANAALLSVTTAFAIRRQPKAAWLSAGFAVLAVAAAAIFITHETEGRIESIAVAIETVATLASGPITYHFVRAALALPVKVRPTLAHFAPAIIGLIASPLLALGTFEPPAPATLVFYQASYTVAALATFFRERKAGDRSAFGFWWPAGFLATMASIHAGQAMRFLSADPAFTNVVVVIAATSVFGLMLIALTVERAAQKAAGVRYAKSSLDAARAADVYAQLIAALEREKLHLRPGLSLADLAGAAGVAPHHASQALVDIGKTTFNELIARARVEEAKRLLQAPENAGVAVEPLGMEAGFKSRSAFYTAFRAAIGMTPAEFRRRQAETVSSPAGADTDAAALGEAAH
jgi:AraC-like DNA-binding protein